MQATETNLSEYAQMLQIADNRRAKDAAWAEWKRWERNAERVGPFSPLGRIFTYFSESSRQEWEERLRADWKSKA